MNKWTKPIGLIWIVTAPHLAAALSMVYCVRSGVLPATGTIAALTGALFASAAAAAVCALARRRRDSLPKGWVLGWLAGTVALFGALIALIYPIPQPTQTLGIESGLLLLGSISVAGLSLMHRAPDETWLRRALGYGFALPALCALGLSIPRSMHPLNDVALCAAVGLGCFGLLALARIPLPTATAREAAIDGAASPRVRPHERMWIVALFAIVLPLVGLSLSNSMGLNMGFSSAWFYGIAVLNGLLMLPIERARGRLVRFYLKAVGFGYIAYFALVFLPFTLYGVIGLLVVAGVLLLTPMIVLLLEIAQLRAEYRALSMRHSPALLWGLLIAGVLTLPMILGADMAADRANYRAALASIESGAPSAHVDRRRLSRALTAMNAINRRFESAPGLLLHPEAWAMWMHPGDGETPILSRAYGKLVLDNQPLSKTRTLALYQQYFDGAQGTPRPDLSSWSITQAGFELVACEARSSYDAEAGVYRSWVDLTIRSERSAGNQLFDTRFALDRGSFITDYSLFVGRENKRGLLSERKAAQAVFDSIVERRRDPGMIQYQGPNELSLKVFPFSAFETRRTSFQVTHVQPLTLTIEGHALTLDAPSQTGLHAPIDMGAHENCTERSCKQALPYTGDAYRDAAVLRHNATIEPKELAHVRKAFESRVLTPGTAFIVLETADQEAALRAMQERVMNGEPLPENLVSMSEPGLLVALALACCALLIARGRIRRRVRARRLP